MDDGNGDKEFQGVTIDLKTLQRQDGLIAEAIDKSRNQNQGVIMTILTAEQDDKNYRQILKRARWKNPEEIDKAVLALGEARMTGAKNAEQIILDRVTAHSAGIDAQIIRESYEALTHTTFTNRLIGDSKRRQEYDNYRSRNSPIA